jgi:Flp pilus assembly pilin Flp
MRSWFREFVCNEGGQDLIEYGLLVGIITAVVVTAVSAIGPKVEDYLNDLDSILPAAD